MMARLIVEAGAAVPAGCELPFHEPVRLGRGLDSTIVLNDKHASRRHAEVYADEGRWLVRDCESTNGTKIDGRPLTAPTVLRDGAVIEVGDVRLRFTTDAAQEGTAELPAVADSDPPILAPVPAADLGETALQTGEVTALYTFLSASLHQTTPQDLIQLALAAVLQQTGAAVAGFLNLDPDDPLPKIVLPAQAHVDVQLSKRLTQRAVQERRAVWLAAPAAEGLEGDSLVGYRDALCMPLHEDKSAAEDSPLGALHVYRSGRTFSEREVRFCEVLADCLAGHLRGLRSRRALEADVTRLRGRSHGGDDALIGDSAAMRQVRDQIARLADCPCSVLITGETGVGKELVAQGLHRRSRRRRGPLVTVNCAAIPADLAEAELFGHAEGAFTGAVGASPGYFQRADEGTLFLDEIGELPYPFQAKFLRALETKTFWPVRGKAEVTVDVRILLATNRDLEREVQAGRFRRDLFYRVTTAIKVPPLRDHAEDIPALAAHFLAKIRAEYPRPAVLSPAALKRLQAFSWPGNVRQLRSVLEAAVALAKGDVINAPDLHLTEEPAAESADLPLNLEELEALAIRRALAQTGGNNARAAGLLGIHRDTLLTKLKKYRIDRPG